LIMRPVLGEQQREMALRTGVRAVISSAGGQPSNGRVTDAIDATKGSSALSSMQASPGVRLLLGG
jgi:hypothetical protein